MAARYTELEWMTINKDFESKGVKLISEFTFANQNHKFICLDTSCGLEFEANFSNVRSNKQGCSPCRKLARGKDKNSTSSEVLESRAKELRDRNIVMLGEYTNSADRYEWKCLKCDHHWMSSYLNIYNGKKGCARCVGKAVSTQDIQDRLAALKIKNIEMLDHYVSSNVNAKFRCLAIDCNHTWEVNAGTVLRGATGCARCKKVFTTEDDRTKRVSGLLNRDVQLIGPLLNMRNKHEFKCLKESCGFVWSAAFNAVYHRGSGCPKCKGFYKTEDEKLKTFTIRKLRHRMSGQYYKGLMPTKKSKTDMSNLLKNYWFEQCKSIPNRPSTGYELDHILPMTLFDPNNHSHMLDCWSHKNMQWLIKAENIAKFNRLEPKYFTDWHHEVLAKMGIKCP